jgi:hypothetical protein
MMELRPVLLFPCFAFLLGFIYLFIDSIVFLPALKFLTGKPNTERET